jgi:hypothetical protein
MGAGLASLSRLLGRRARLRSRDRGALGRRGGTAGLARHDGRCDVVWWVVEVVGDAGSLLVDMCLVREKKR